jgi:hypothetical protein
LVTTPEAFNYLNEGGWQPEEHEGLESLSHHEFEAYLKWDSRDDRPNFDELLKSAQTIEGCNFVGLQRLLAWKKAKGRPKDLKDIELIEVLLD